jgi:hypothetical protein
MTEAEYVHVCVVCCVPLSAPWQVCSERCYHRVVAMRVAA